MHTTVWMQLNYATATMFNNYNLVSIKVLKARNRGQIHPCRINMHGVTRVAALSYT